MLPADAGTLGDGQSPDTLVLCATSRLARSLRAADNRKRAARGETRWPTLETATLAQWLSRFAEEALLRGSASGTPLAARPLDAFQERLLWEQVIANGFPDFAASFFDLPGMAQSAAEANALMLAWEIRPTGSEATDETREFLAWQRTFRQRCAERGFIEAARLQRGVIELIGQGGLRLPACILFAGFDHCSPLERELKATLARQGVEVGEWRFREAQQQALSRFSYADRESECRAVAQWAAARIEENPALRLCIATPDLAGVRDMLEAALDDALHPWFVRPMHGEMQRAYNFSLGKPLTSHPLIAAALSLIELGTAHSASPIEQERLSELLRHPFWSASITEADARAICEAEMRRRLPASTTLAQLLSLARHLTAAAHLRLPRLVAELEALDASARGARRALPPSQWATLFSDLLGRAGWPGERPLSSHEFQARQAFFDELAKLAALDALLGEVPAHEARRRLAQLCTQHVFQAETQGEPPLQVMGMLEADGLEFDALWVMGMTDNAWPPAPRPNPLLPAELQRKAGAPNASAAIQLAFAATMHQRMLASAPVICFSHARMQGTTELRPSPLLRELPDAGEAASTSLGRLEDGPWDAPLDDACAPPVAPGEQLAGGTGLLKAQAICPAWGYFRYRLGARELEAPVDGLDARARGDIVHAALCAFWSVHPASGELRAMSAEERAAALVLAVDAALAGHDAKAFSQPFKPVSRLLERERLLRLLDGWLAIELERAEPFHVAACELEVECDIEGIAARFKIDRIDHLGDDRRIVIDYKTGRALGLKSWAEARIGEPQLPIYAAIAQGGAVHAAAFACVVPDDHGFAGIAADPGLLPGVAALDSREGRRIFAAERYPDWASVMVQWASSLRAVAREAMAGDAAVRFAAERDLAYCDVLPLLRLPERRAQWEALQASEGFS